jgi:hypothetical protein
MAHAACQGNPAFDPMFTAAATQGRLSAVWPTRGWLMQSLGMESPGTPRITVRGPEKQLSACYF